MPVSDLLSTAYFGPTARCIPAYDYVSPADVWLILILLLSVIIAPLFIYKIKKPTGFTKPLATRFFDELDKYKPYSINLRRAWYILTIAILCLVLEYQFPHMLENYSAAVEKKDNEICEKSTAGLDAELAACMREKNLTQEMLWAKYRPKCSAHMYMDYCIRINLIKDCGFTRHRTTETIWEKNKKSLSFLYFGITKELFNTLLLMIFLPIGLAFLPRCVVAAYKWIRPRHL
jgi:hypothetical protein